MPRPPKFYSGQLVKYVVAGQTRYNEVLEPVWNVHAHRWFYKLNEPMAMPVYREAWLSAVGEVEHKKIMQANINGKVRLHKTGYITIEEEPKDE